MEGNTDRDQRENDRRRTEIGIEIRAMYLGWNQMVGRDEMKHKTKLENLLTSNIQLLWHRGQRRWRLMRAMYRQKWKPPLSTLEIKWPGKMKSRDKEIAIEIRAFFGPQMKWKRGRKSGEMKNTTIWNEMPDRVKLGQHKWNSNVDFLNSQQMAFAKS